MKRLLMTAAIVGLAAAPALAQNKAQDTLLGTQPDAKRSPDVIGPVSPGTNLQQDKATSEGSPTITLPNTEEANDADADDTGTRSVQAQNEIISTDEVGNSSSSNKAAKALRDTQPEEHN